jgi:ATP-dependent exoDNAse (exonuclease V) beta subunit
LNVYLDAKDCGDMFEIGEEELEQKKEIIQNEYAITPPQTQSMWVFDGDNFKNEYINDENYLGSLLHDLLMHVYTSNDITKLIEKIKTEPKYTKLTQKWIIKNLNAIQNNEALKPYFDETKTVKNEIEIAYQAGELIRIDKLISDENQCVILDYKTGIERKEHHAQMVFYKNILHQLNYKNVKAVLYYTNDNKIVTL